MLMSYQRDNFKLYLSNGQYGHLKRKIAIISLDSEISWSLGTFKRPYSSLTENGAKLGKL
jgi:hypothetical protein